MKPAFGAGGIDSLVVESASGFARLMASETGRRYQDYPAILLAEKYTEIEAEYHCDGLVVDGRTVFASVSRYFAPLFGRNEELTGSWILPEADAIGAEICRLHAGAVAALGLCGESLIWRCCKRPVAC